MRRGILRGSTAQHGTPSEEAVELLPQPGRPLNIGGISDEDDNSDSPFYHVGVVFSFCIIFCDFLPFDMTTFPNTSVVFSFNCPSSWSHWQIRSFTPLWLAFWPLWSHTTIARA
jgi:hypothetical protein